MRFILVQFSFFKIASMKVVSWSLDKNILDFIEIQRQFCFFIRHQRNDEFSLKAKKMSEKHAECIYKQEF